LKDFLASKGIEIEGTVKKPELMGMVGEYFSKGYM
jgi:hypothetical protein